MRVRLLPLVIFTAAVFIALFTYRDYGIGWDEPVQQLLGAHTYNYVAHNDTTLLHYENRDYGPAFEWLLANIQRLVHVKTFAAIYHTRHLAMHLFFLVCSVFVYLLIQRQHRSVLLAVSGQLLFLSCPLIYSHSFFNSKDVPFMALFPVCFYLFSLALDSRRWWRWALAGAVTGAMIDIRIMAVIVPPVFIAILGVQLWSRRGKGWLRDVVNASVYLFAAALFVYMLWPNLWHAPFTGIAHSFSEMSHFRWVNDVRFMGKNILSDALPWYYVPVWFLITLPLPFLTLGFVGVYVASRDVSASVFRRNLSRQHLEALAYIVLFVAPVIAVVALHSVIYDGWRQLFFIFAPFVFLLVYGISALRGRLRIAALGLAAVSVVLSVIFLVRWHPFGHLYFNALADPYTGEHIRKNYEFDYWGLSYKQSIDVILERDTAAIIPVAAQNPPFDLNVELLPDRERSRIRVVTIPEARYFVTNFRWHPEDYSEAPFNNQVWGKVMVGKNTANAIYRLR